MKTALLVCLALVVGGLAACGRSGGGQTSTAERVQMYTCPRHPEILQPQPGDCPICGSTLVPVSPRPATGFAAIRAPQDDGERH